MVIEMEPFLLPYDGLCPKADTDFQKDPADGCIMYRAETDSHGLRRMPCFNNRFLYGVAFRFDHLLETGSIILSVFVVSGEKKASADAGDGVVRSDEYLEENRDE